MGGLRLALRPFNQQPLLLSHPIVMCCANTHVCKCDLSGFVAPLPPPQVTLHLRGEGSREFQHRDRLVSCITALPAATRSSALASGLQG